MNEDKVFRENFYRAFPIDMKGRYFEAQGSSKETKLIIYVDSQRNPQNDREKMLDEINPSSWSKRMSLVPDKNIIWLYRLECFEVKLNDVRFDNSWNVSDWAFNYQEFFFESFESLSSYVSNRWGVNIYNFVRDYDISIPLG